MTDGCAEGDGPEDVKVAWIFSDLSSLSDLSDLEDRLMRFRNPPFFFFSPSCDSELFRERLRKDTTDKGTHERKT